MSLTFGDVCSEIQYHLIETVDSGATWSSGLWTTGEVLAYMNNRINQFLRESQILLKRSDISTIPMEIRHDLPSDFLLGARATWEDADGEITEIPRGSAWEADNYLGSSWPITGNFTKPHLWTDGDVQNLKLAAVPAVMETGTINVTYVYSPTDQDGQAATVIPLPIEFVQAIKYGVMADMLGKVGRGQDIQRASYCEQRYQEGVQTAKIILKGWL